MNTIINYAIASWFFTAAAAVAAPGSPSLPHADLSGSSIPSFAKEGRVVEGNNMVWGENSGWVNLGARHGGLRIGSNVLAGWIWFENCGWTCVGDGKPQSGKHYSNESARDWGVNNDGKGNLSGFAWSEVAGWINFSASHSRVHLDTQGRFCGYAWGENVGWIKFGPGGRVNYLAKADPGPWREIGTDELGILIGRGGSGGSIEGNGVVAVSGLARCSERYDENAGVVWVYAASGDAAGECHEVVETPVQITDWDNRGYIRGPPALA